MAVSRRLSETFSNKRFLINRKPSLLMADCCLLNANPLIADGLGLRSGAVPNRTYRYMGQLEMPGLACEFGEQAIE